MKKMFVPVLLLALAAALNGAEITAQAAGKNASVKTVAPGVWELSVAPGQGWGQLHLACPPLSSWGTGKVALTVKLLEPETARCPGVLLCTEGPKDAVERLYFHTELAQGRPVRVTARQKGDKVPRALSIAVKNAAVPVRLEVSQVVFHDDPAALKPAAAKTAKPRLAPLPALKFKGKPFFPLGAFETYRVGESGQLGSMDERFLAAGGNCSMFGIIYLGPDDTTNPAYRKVAGKTGIDQVLEGLEKARKNPAFDNVALIVKLGCNILLDESEAAATGMSNMLKPVSGEKLALRKKALGEAVRRFSSYPNVLGYTIDEPENMIWQYYKKYHQADWDKEKDRGLARRMTEWLRWYPEVIRAADPNALCMPILGWYTVYAHCGELYDVLIADHYPSKPPEYKEFDAKLYEVNYDAALAVAAARKNGKTAIYMPQMFDNLHKNRPLTIDEQLYVMFAPITRGCMGIIGWRLQRSSDKHRKFVVYPAMKEVDNLKEFLLGEWHDELVTSDRDTASVDYLKKFQERVRELEGMEDAEVVSVSQRDAVPDVTYCLRKHPDGRYLLLCVNNLRTPVEATFTIDLPKLPRFMVDNINRNDKVWFKGKQAKIKFAPFGVHAYIIQP